MLTVALTSTFDRLVDRRAETLVTRTLNAGFRFRCLDNDGNGGTMRPLPPGQDAGVDYCKIRRDRNHHHHHHTSNNHRHHQNHHHGGVGGGGGGTLRRSSASSAPLLEPPPSAAERYHGTVEGHYRVHDLALDRYVPPPSPERYSSSAGRSYHHHQPPPDDRYTSSSSASSSTCHGGSTGGGGGRGHYLPVSQSASESFMSPPSPVAERFDYAARHHDGYAAASKRNEPIYSR